MTDMLDALLDVPPELATGEGENEGLPQRGSPHLERTLCFVLVAIFEPLGSYVQAHLMLDGMFSLCDQAPLTAA